jgi:hypothetical protein
MAVSQQIARLQAEVHNLQAQPQLRPPVTKDLSLVTFLPKWVGKDKEVPCMNFFGNHRKYCAYLQLIT